MRQRLVSADTPELTVEDVVEWLKLDEKYKPGKMDVSIKHDLPFCVCEDNTDTDT
jgi:hypothetical protein